MKKQKFDRVKKILCVLLLVFFVINVTAASASVAPYKSSSYQRGYMDGARDGYNNGYKDGKDDCLKYGRIRVLKKIRAPVVKDNWNKNYKRGYRAGYNNRYLISYHYGRYGCLEKEHVELQQ